MRRARESLLSEMPVGCTERAMDGICEVGMVPPPVVAVDDWLVILAFEILPILLSIWSALACRFSVLSARFLRVGMSVLLGSDWVRRYSSMLSWSTVRMSLSHLTARKKGSFLMPATSSDFPAIMPDCGPPRSLSPEKHTRSMPFFRAACGVGSWSIGASSSVFIIAPEPMSSTRGNPCLWARSESSLTSGSSVNPPI